MLVCGRMIIVLNIYVNGITKEKNNMLLLVIFALVIVVGIVFCAVIAHRSYWDDEAWAFLGGLLITLGAIGLIGGGIAAIVIESEESIIYENAIAE